MHGTIFKLPLSMFVLLITFGLYMVATLWFGAFLDLIQKQHIKTVVKQKASTSIYDVCSILIIPILVEATIEFNAI